MRVFWLSDGSTVQGELIIRRGDFWLVEDEYKRRVEINQRHIVMVCEEQEVSS